MKHIKLNWKGLSLITDFSKWQDMVLQLHTRSRNWHKFISFSFTKQKQKRKWLLSLQASPYLLYVQNLSRKLPNCWGHVACKQQWLDLVQTRHARGQLRCMRSTPPRKVKWKRKNKITKILEKKFLKTFRNKKFAKQIWKKICGQIVYTKKK